MKLQTIKLKTPHAYYKLILQKQTFCFTDSNVAVRCHLTHNGQWMKADGGIIISSLNNSGRSLTPWIDASVCYSAHWIVGMNPIGSMATIGKTDAALSWSGFPPVVLAISRPVPYGNLHNGTNQVTRSAVGTVSKIQVDNANKHVFINSISFPDSYKFEFSMKRNFLWCNLH